LGARLDQICREHGIEHRLTKPKHPWTNGQVERMNRTIKDATVKRYFYETHDQLRVHLRDFVDAYNFARRLKTLRGLTPYEFVCKAWTSQPQRFKLNPVRSKNVIARDVPGRVAAFENNMQRGRVAFGDIRHAESSARVCPASNAKFESVMLIRFQKLIHVDE
jgi:hypothetical protein